MVYVKIDPFFYCIRSNTKHSKIYYHYDVLLTFYFLTTLRSEIGKKKFNVFCAVEQKKSF